MIRRCIALIDQPEATKSAASHSSSSGWVGGVPRRPKSEGVGTIGLPKWCCQIRLTITRAVRCRGGPSVSQRARAEPAAARRRAGRCVPSGSRTFGTPRGTTARRACAGRRRSGASRRSARRRGRRRPAGPAASGPGLLEPLDLAAELLELAVALPRRPSPARPSRLDASAAAADRRPGDARRRTRPRPPPGPGRAPASSASPSVSASASFALSRASASACFAS